MLETLNLSTARTALRELALEDPLPAGSPPSTYAAYAVVTGEPGGWPRAIVGTLVRAGIIGTGLYAAGQRRKIMRSALYASVAVEIFVLGYAAHIAGKKTAGE